MTNPAEGWAWLRGVYDEQDTDHYRLTLDGKYVARLKVTLPEIAVTAANDVVPLKWTFAEVEGLDALVLSGAVDSDVPPIAILTPYPEESWLLVSDATLPPLADGPLRITFPHIPPIVLKSDED